MTEFRFIHTSDLHLGKRFGNFPEEVRGDLVQARQSILGNLADAARDHGAAHILVAGDVFDTETPSDRVWRQALTAMGATPELHWWIIPGNHDSLTAESLWQNIVDHAPANVHVLRAAEPVEIASQVTLLPAPAPRRFPGVDLTAWMNTCDTPDGHLRIGLAHGGVLEFGSDDGSSETIAPDRAESARLDYLALGDWHGVWTLNDRTRYSGAPERDRFKHAGRGICLAVTLPALGAVPLVEEIAVGRFDWQEKELQLTPELDPLAAFTSLLPEDRQTWRDTLIKVRVTGWMHLPARMSLAEAVNQVAPEFCHFEFDDHQLQTEYSPDDLDEIARSGALRLAAEQLQSAAEDDDAAKWDRDVAAAALNRLYGFVKGAKL